MTPEQIERGREAHRVRSAIYRAKVKDTPEFKAKCKLVRENRTEEQRAQARDRRRKWRQTIKSRIVRAKYRNSDKGQLYCCRHKLAEQLGVAAKHLPDELVAAKFAQLKVKRLIRDLG